MNRRQVLAAAVTFVAMPLAAAPVPIKQSLRDAFGDVEVGEGHVVVSIPPLAENGNSVSLEVTAEAPPGALVTSLRVLSDVNPLPVIGVFSFGRGRESVRVATRIRLADTQRIVVAAEMSDGTVWTGSGTTIVTLAACVDVE